MLCELVAHTHIEVRAFYPFVRALNKTLNDQILEALEEHHVAKATLAEHPIARPWSISPLPASAATTKHVWFTPPTTARAAGPIVVRPRKSSTVSHRYQRSVGPFRNWVRHRVLSAPGWVKTWWTIVSWATPRKPMVASIGP
jgi:hypothetical protein